MNDSICAIILAAGKGKRMKSKTQKVLCEVVFKPMLNWVVDVCKNVGCKDNNICIVTSEDNEEIIKVTKGKFNYAVQKKRLGTAHAVSSAIEFLKKTEKKDVLIMLGDAPLVYDEIIKNFYSYHLNEQNSVSILSSSVKNSFGYGRIIRDKKNNNKLLKIVEEAECTELEKNVLEINSGVFCFNKLCLLDVLTKIDNDNSKGEYYITSAVDILLKEGKKVGAFNCYDDSVVLGANTKMQLMQINNIARLKIIEKHIERGVNFISIDGVVISPDVLIGQNTVIYPNVILKGNTVIGEDCLVTSNSYIENSVIGDYTVVKSSYIENSNVGKNVKIGPFSNIRPNVNINDMVKIGDFVEVKNSNIGEKTSVAHLTYIGDTDVGKNVNVGCGCVTVNYDGVNKYRTVIGDDCFIGCNTNLIAPLKVGNNVYTAAGSTVTDDVPDNSMCIARSRQVIKNNWNIKK